MHRIVLTFFLIGSFITKASAEPSAEALLFQMQRGYHHNNFELVMAHILQNNIEPLRLTHGWNNRTEITHLLTLSGRPIEYLGKNKQVTFAESAQVSYTLQESQLPGLWFSMLNCSPETLLKYYEVVSTGKSRIAGQVAQLVRLTAKEDSKYSFIIWLEQKTGILLRLDVNDAQGNLVEQYLGIDFRLLSENSTNIKTLASMKVPPAATNHDIYRAEPASHQWTLGWLPSGFVPLSSDQHKLIGSDELVDYFMLSDGLVDVSVYISRSSTGIKGREKEQIAMHGATSIFSINRDDGVTLTVVGELPLLSLRRIAETIRANK
ncbi:MucB/RseB C-terminal domain-containing protein [Tolumonas auensis]|uniref:MucB/RseB C-terminal domain-containing protein n=1 Tax=Tolumonas auensis TaxID=43948 RepID=UPI002AA8A68E|nr:MucB/RseB C-terminal domain-containing protein [Tolumonas auensis]